ncbi:hypothetical protein MTR67_034655 [Solanum verrucosum]|uniref:Tf2-1-like SH3-like domain-containing protein n=1 Tax=Solanum verrucosum TaxID=315347 RepID=A0AAF0ZKN5_SOLVR|nr:hypothetical protein MTR67_034655 [Solanum verrucosum]
MNGVMRFCKKGNLSPQYDGPYQILRRFGKVAYELDLPSELALVHPVYHFSMLKKCVDDLTYIVSLEGLEVDESLSYEEVPVEILDRQVKKLRDKEVASVKVVATSRLPKTAPSIRATSRLVKVLTGHGKACGGAIVFGEVKGSCPATGLGPRDVLTTARAVPREG